MNDKHTPGPWVYVEGFRENYYSFTVYTEKTYPTGSVNNLQICSGYAGVNECFAMLENGEANARLIALSPEMFDELVKVEKLLTAINITDYSVSEELENVRSLIKKARGEE